MSCFPSQSRAECTTEYLLELNSDVSGDFIEAVKMIIWFNNEQKSQFNITEQQILFNDYILPLGLQGPLRRKVEIFVILVRKFIYKCKMTEKTLHGSEFKQN